jgi:hypothetical protein
MFNREQGTYPSKIFRRFLGLFWPLFDFKVLGVIFEIDIAPKI